MECLFDIVLCSRAVAVFVESESLGKCAVGESVVAAAGNECLVASLEYAILSSESNGEIAKHRTSYND